MTLFRSYTQMMLVIYLSFGTVIGLLFPLFVSPFIDVRDGFVWIFTIACVLAGVMLGLLNYYIFILFITSCAKKFRNVFLGVREGNLQVRSDIISYDMIGDIAKDINETISFLEMADNMAKHDELTGLPNRLYLQNWFKGLNNKKATFIYFDLNNFKKINDKYGHTVGDQVLISLSAIIQMRMHHLGKLVRLGGDEFVFLQLNKTSKEEIQQTILHLLECFTELTKVNEKVDHLSPSIGISEYPKDGNDLMTLLMYADIAMYEVKNQRISGYYAYYNELVSTEAN